jgi:CRP-like cAMP-binding protein
MCRCLYIIKKGIIKLSKNIEKPNLNSIKYGVKTKSGGSVSATSLGSSSSFSASANKDNSEVPGLWVMEKNWRDRLESFDDAGSTSPTNLQGTNRASAHTTSRSGRSSLFTGASNPHTHTDFTVGVLGSGQVFGELAVLDPDGEVLSPVSAISFTPVELYVFESEALVEVGAGMSVVDFVIF